MKNYNILNLNEPFGILLLLLIQFPQICQFFNLFDLFSKYTQMHSDFVIWNSLSYLDLSDVLPKHSQLSFVGDNSDANFRDLTNHMQNNFHEKITVLIFLNTSIVEIESNIAEVGLKDQQNPFKFDFETNSSSRVSYFLFWQDTNSDNLYENTLLKKWSRKFSLASDVYIVRLGNIKFHDSTHKLFASPIDIFELYSIREVSILQKVTTVFNISNTYSNANFLAGGNDFLDLKILNKVSRRKNFYFTKVIAVSQPGESNRIVMTENENGTATLIKGHEVEEYRFLRDYFNFSEYAVNSSGWAYANDKGELMGMAAQVIKNEADIGITNSELLESFLKDLIFLHPTYFSTMRCFFVQPPSGSIRDIFLQPFTLNLWLAMFTTWAGIVLTMILLLKIIHAKLHKLYEFENSLLQEVWLWASGSACQQGWYFSPESTPAKIVLISGSTMSCILVTAYSATLVAILSVKVYPVKSLDDLINQKFTIYRGNEIYSTTYILNELVSRGKMREEKSISSEDAVDKILTSKFALLGIYDVFHPAARQKISDKTICSVLSQIPVNWRPITAAMFLPKYSEYKEYFNYVLVKMHERGNRFRLLSIYMRDSSVLCEQHQDYSFQTNEELELNDVFTSIAIMLTGIIISIVTFIAERLFSLSVQKSWQSV